MGCNEHRFTNLRQIGPQQSYTSLKLLAPLEEYASCISGLVVEYNVAIVVTRVRFPADATINTVQIQVKKAKCFAGRTPPSSKQGAPGLQASSPPLRPARSRISGLDIIFDDNYTGLAADSREGCPPCEARSHVLQTFWQVS